LEHPDPNCLLYFEATVSITEYLQSHCAEDAFGGPVTNNKLSESDGETGDLSWLELGSDSEGSNSEIAPQQSSSNTQSKNKKERHKQWNQQKRQATQEAVRTDLKAMVRRQQLESSQIAIQSDYSAENDVLVSSSGWIGLLPQVHRPI
jgi:hypothetical protein